MSGIANQTERTGIHAVGLIFEKEFKWIFREQTVSDYGIDAQVEIKDNEGNPTGGLIREQVPSFMSDTRSVWSPKKLRPN